MGKGCRKGSVLVLAALFGLSSAWGAVEKSAKITAEFRPGEIVAKMKPAAEMGVASMGLRTAALGAALDSLFASNQVNTFVTDEDLVVIRVQTKDSMENSLAKIKATGLVEYAEPNYIYTTQELKNWSTAVLPNDPDFEKLWGLQNTGQNGGTAGADIKAVKAWEHGTGSREVVVAVIDTGIDYDHPDLKDNIFANAAEIPGNGIDDDHNGFVDDVHGWNFNAKNNNPMDDNRHGTHCSGTIGGSGNNGVGVAGVSWKVRLLPVKFLSASGSGSLADAVESIKYATKMGANIMSNSWGGGGFSQAMFDAIKEARDHGILFVAAAGNNSSNNDSNPMYPASYDSENMLSVAATDNKDAKASFSNWGARTVHLGAPGVNIYSTVPRDKGNYGTLSGTSMACPHVSGAAALLWSMNRSMTFADVKRRLMSTVDATRAMRGKTITGGRLNIDNAVTNTVPPRNEPTPDSWRSAARRIETEHPYKNGATLSFDVSHPGAKYLRVRFSKIATEQSYDTIRVKNANGDVVDEISGSIENRTSEYVEGDKLILEFTSDSSVDGWGFAIDQYEYVM